MALTSLAASGCKTRNPDAEGVLSDQPAAAAAEPAATEASAGASQSAAVPAAPVVASGGYWTLTCKPRNGSDDEGPTGGDTTGDTYTVSVAGAVGETDQDQSQPVTVTVLRSHGTAQQVVASNASGHGALSLGGNILVAFDAGVLTAEAAGGGHPGVLTLLSDPDANGLKVDCDVAKVTRGL